MTNILDDLLAVEGTRKAALDELSHMLGRVNYADMETYEVVAFVGLFRPVYERAMQEQRDKAPPAEPIPLKLVGQKPKGTQGRQVR